MYIGKKLHNIYRPNEDQNILKTTTSILAERHQYQHNSS